MRLPIKIALVAGTIAVAGIAAYVFCAKGVDTLLTRQTGGGQKEKPTVRTPMRDAPKAVQEEPAGRQAANGEARPSRPSHRAAAEAARREREAFKKMSPEEQQRFREKKREEFLERRRAAKDKGGREKGRRVRRKHGSRDSEPEDLRSAAIKARDQYEKAMDEEERSGYKRRPLGYWMGRIKHRRERAAERERGHPMDNGANAGAEASGNRQETTPKTTHPKTRKE